MGSIVNLSDVQLPKIEFTIDTRGWGSNFVRLDTPSVWKKLTEASKADIVSEDTVKLALQHFSTIMAEPTFAIDSLIEMQFGIDGKTPVVYTKKPLFLRIRRFYMDPHSSTGKGNNLYLRLKNRAVVHTNTLIKREKPSSYRLWKDHPTKDLTQHRKLARTMAETHNVDEGWMMYGISVALRMIECLLCDGHVIVIPNKGRFWARNISSDYHQSIRGFSTLTNDVRIVFQAREDYGFKYKRPQKS